MFHDHLDDLFDIAYHDAVSQFKTEQWTGCFLRHSERSESRPNDSYTQSKSKPHIQIKRVMKRQTSAGNNLVIIKQAVVES